MNYLVLLLSGIIGHLVYSIYKKEYYKTCPYCAETIKREAMVCRYCGKDLVTPAKAIVQNIEQIKSDIVDDNLKKLSAMASLSLTKKVLETQIFVLRGVKLLAKRKK